MIHHALALHFHQPAGNLEFLWEHEPWEAERILFALDRIPRTLWPYQGLGKVHISLSGTLLETLSNPSFQQLVYGKVDCGTLLWYLQNEEIIRVLGSAYYHPVLPLIPIADREPQVERWLGIGKHLFNREKFTGFWPPEMGFTMEMIPLLKRFGYRYVFVDSEHVEALTPMSWEELHYRPHIARNGTDSIVVIVRDRDLSNAQESGMDYGWFSREVHDRTRWCNFEPLVTTCSDGDNGGWFRDTSPHNNFWGVFYQEFMAQAQSGTDDIRPAFVEDYLDEHGTYGEVYIRPGAWNTGWHHGRDFQQWTGSQAQKDALARVHAISKIVHEVHWQNLEQQDTNHALEKLLESTMWHLLRSETSCNFYWGEAWVHRCHEDLNDCVSTLEAIHELLTNIK
ncbi:glycoside hydrolase family 57 [Methylotuvimicrobium buryatense]|uniref:Glycoside hydrolase family 57 n=1 Tax=Methylotuvimicrobium buryatense TaxID=95641 RepID=A0A4P9UM11_METBY|nr:glycoside hydrolase family 57 [Methylotuvimicrobium buryatense]QCW82248.1 glycoside hydrolase family 57 [Methylotuvimicrobium buryatense]